jgi:hypothetical protein
VCAVSILITEMGVPRMPESPGVSILAASCSHQYSRIKPHVIMFFITVWMIQLEKFVTDGRRLHNPEQEEAMLGNPWFFFFILNNLFYMPRNPWSH